MSTIDDHDALGTAQPPNAAAAARRGLFGREETPQPDPAAKSMLELREQVAELARAIVNSTVPDGPTGIASGMTDASGNAFIIVYSCAAGEQFRLHRALVEAQGYTWAAPYSAGSAFLGLYSLQNTAAPASFTGIADVYQGAQKDGGPPVAGGPILPVLFADEDAQASEVRGPNSLVLMISGGPASKRITVNYQGSLRRARGIA